MERGWIAKILKTFQKNKNITHELKCTVILLLVLTYINVLPRKMNPKFNTSEQNVRDFGPMKNIDSTARKCLDEEQFYLERIFVILEYRFKFIC